MALEISNNVSRLLYFPFERTGINSGELRQFFNAKKKKKGDDLGCATFEQIPKVQKLLKRPMRVVSR